MFRVLFVFFIIFFVCAPLCIVFLVIPLRF
jgi:hypothetical protein